MKRYYYKIFRTIVDTGIDIFEVVRRWGAPFSASLPTHLLYLVFDGKVQHCSGDSGK